MNPNIQMMDFKLDTFEDVGGFPEIRIDAKAIFPVVKGLCSIDMAKLKRLVVEAIYESATLESIE